MMNDEEIRAMSDEELAAAVARLVALRAWGAPLARLTLEQSRRHGRAMAALVGSPAANRYYD